MRSILQEVLIRLNSRYHTVPELCQLMELSFNYISGQMRVLRRAGLARQVYDSEAYHRRGRQEFTVTTKGAMLVEEFIAGEKSDILRTTQLSPPPLNH